MDPCWKCGETPRPDWNYCNQCASPLKPRMAAHTFDQSAMDFYTGLSGLLELIDGCPEILAQGLAEEEEDLSAAEWENRFESSYRWIKAFFFRLWLRHYDLTQDDLDRFIDEHRDKIETLKDESEELPTAANESCSCGADLPANPPVVITQWKDAMEATAVCFVCFGQINSEISVAE